jgi:hypothetical protein
VAPTGPKPTMRRRRSSVVSVVSAVVDILTPVPEGRELFGDAGAVRSHHARVKSTSPKDFLPFKGRAGWGWGRVHQPLFSHCVRGELHEIISHQSKLDRLFAPVCDKATRAHNGAHEKSESGLRMPGRASSLSKPARMSRPTIDRSSRHRANRALPAPRRASIRSTLAKPARAGAVRRLGGVGEGAVHRHHDRWSCRAGSVFAADRAMRRRRR